jgi:tRNA(Arg) A34 adenosine deaminase TadA
MLRQLGIRKVYFGAVNDKFGGTGGVFSIHANSPPAGTANEHGAASSWTPKTNGAGNEAAMTPSGIMTWKPMEAGRGDGGNVEPGYPVEGGWGRDEAVGLLRRFYVQENGRGKSSCPGCGLCA